MKKLTTALLLASATAFNASAITFEFDPDQDGTFLDSDVLTLGLFPNDPVSVQQFFDGGADDTQLDSGDRFTESFTYNNNDNTGNPDVIFPLNALEFSLNLEGTIENVMYGAGIPTIGDADLFTDLAATSFETNFDLSSANANVALTVSWLGSVIGEFDLVEQVNTPVVTLDGSNTNSAFVFEFAFDEAWVLANQATLDNVWRQDGGDLIDPTNFTLQLTGSAGPNGTFDTANLGDATPFLTIFTKDNGTTVIAQVVPEPASIAIMALGLLGVAGLRRKS